jgi:hypothetical protein
MFIGEALFLVNLPAAPLKLVHRLVANLKTSYGQKPSDYLLDKELIRPRNTYSECRVRLNNLSIKKSAKNYLAEIKQIVQHKGTLTRF